MNIDEVAELLKPLGAQMTMLRQSAWSDMPDVQRHIDRLGEWSCQLSTRTSAKRRLPDRFPVWGTGRTPSEAIQNAILRWREPAKKWAPSKKIEAQSGDDLLKALGL